MVGEEKILTVGASGNGRTRSEYNVEIFKLVIIWCNRCGQTSSDGVDALVLFLPLLLLWLNPLLSILSVILGSRCCQHTQPTMNPLLDIVLPKS